MSAGETLTSPISVSALPFPASRSLQNAIRPALHQPHQIMHELKTNVEMEANETDESLM